jgi:2-methylaconitate cis-trans-isomerase PrpF
MYHHAQMLVATDQGQTVGSSQNKGLLPSGNPLDTISLGGHPVQITICDVANICVFAKALDLCISGHESESSINDNTALIARCKELRGRAATLIGMCNDPEKVDEQSPFLPMVILVAPPATRGGHLSARLFLDNSCHTSMAGTGAICLAACSRILGSVVCNQIGHEALNDAMLQICHPLGIMPVSVQTEKA